MREKWRKVFSFPNYEVSDLGRVRSVDHEDKLGRLRKGRVLQELTSHRDYKQVSLYKEGRQYKRHIHRLVGDAFVSGKRDGYEIDHIDQNAGNNEAVNLQWVTHRDNNVLRQQRKGRKNIGVRKGTWGRWRAEIRINGKKKHLGMFDTEDEARFAYHSAKAALDA